MARRDDADGPVILWLDYGAYEGWKPVSFDDVKEALESQRYGERFRITRVIQYQIQES